MEVNVQIQGLESLARSSKALQAGIEKEIAAGLFASGHTVRTEAIKSIKSGGKTGRIYKRGGVTHQSSAPGEAPATDSGALDTRGISVKLTKSWAVEIIARMMSGGKRPVNYAYELEFGNSKVAARPFMFPAVERSRKRIHDRMKEAVRRGIQRGTRG